MHCGCLAIALLLTLPPAVASRSRLVIVTQNTKQYHRPSCPVVRDGKEKDIIAMNVGQAELRGYKPHRDCESEPADSTSQGIPGQPSDEAKQRPVFVYTTPGDTRYHKENCDRLGKDRTRLGLEEAGKKLWPCSICRPPVRKRTPAIPKR